jgi:uncharacterized protein (DUF1501 family)
MIVKPIDSPCTRRHFLASAGALTAAAALPRLLFAKTGTSARLVVVILRGALDGLAAVPPHADPSYAGLHRDLAIAPPGQTDGALALDTTFGLHPSLRFLHERYAAGELIVFHAVASPYRDRSHFEGQNVLENGLTQPLGTADGWLNRALATLPAATAGSERAVALAQNVPLILRGGQAVLSKSPMLTPDVDDELLARLEDLYSKDDWFSARLSEAVQSERLSDSLAAADAGETPAAMTDGTPAAAGAGASVATTRVGSQPAMAGAASAARTADTGSATGPAGAVVPASDSASPAAPKLDRLGSAARLAAAIMKSPGGPEVAVMEATGWDTHANQGAAKGTLAQRLGGLDAALRMLATDLGDLWAQSAVLVVTEFGRTAAMNGTRGTDHGTGGCAFLAGGAVRGGRVIADWPGLGAGALLDNRDLRPTLDLRSVFKGVLGEHLRIDARALGTTVFPDSGAARALSGLVRA